MAAFLLAARERYALPILQPLSDALLAAGHRVYAWFDGPLTRAASTLSGPIDIVGTKDAVALRPRAVLCAMDWIPPFFAGAKVQLFHGFNTNKHSDERGHFRIRGLFDLYCTQGPATTVPFQKLAEEMGHFAVVETGWSKLDPLFRDDGGASLRLREHARGRPVVMFASTFTPRVSAAPHLYEAIRQEIARRDFFWLLTLHPKCPPELFDRYRALADENARFIEPEQIVTAQRAADVLLSDTTSVVPEFAVQHKPVVTFRHRVPEPYMLDFTEGGELRAALERALSKPQDLMQRVAAYANSIHPYRDGRSSERVIAAVEEIVEHKLRLLKPKPFMSKIRHLQIRRRLRYWGPGASG